MKRRALVFLLLLAACERYDAERDLALKDNLTTMRKALASYRGDHGHYPAKLEDLVPAYLRMIPADPITKAKDWRLETEETVTPSSDFTTAMTSATTSVIVDVHSAAPGSDRNGVLYANY